MVAITVVARHALLELDMGQVGDQLRENSSTDTHPPLFRPTPKCPPHPVFERFQFKSFFRRRLAISLTLRALTDFAKYFTGLQRI
jgi:hypothetical protein